MIFELRPRFHSGFPASHVSHSILFYVHDQPLFTIINRYINHYEPLPLTISNHY